jgi:alpha-glucoside transport system substrate-binding protein
MKTYKVIVILSNLILFGFLVNLVSAQSTLKLTDNPLLVRAASNESGETANDQIKTETQPIYLPVSLREVREVIEILIPAGQENNFEQGFAAFEEATGIDLIFIGSPDFENEIRQRAIDGNLPDLALFPQPGLLADFANAGYTVDLSDWFTIDYLQTQYAQSWLDLASLGDQVIGIWYRASVKSIVYYPKTAFDTAGYEVPQSWVELLALSDHMVSDGRTPWCIGIESGGATGWVGTDWIEDIMLRTTTPSNYDSWVNGDLLFVSNEVRHAFETMARIWFSEDYVLGGRNGILTTSFFDAPIPMFEDQPQCWLHRQATFISNFFPDGVEYGIDYGYFYLPGIDAAYGSPVLMAGDIFGVFSDDHLVRLLVEYLTTAESALWYIESGNGLSPYKQVDLSWYPDDEQRGYAEILMNADTIRFDGSDLMPGEVGAGAFWSGIVDYVNGVDLDIILEGIDLAWP